MPRNACALLLLGLWSMGLAGQAAPAGEAVLSQRHYWRKHYTTFPPAFSADAGPQRPDSLAAMFPEPPPANWAAPDFEDSDWFLAPGLEFEHGVKNLKLIGEMSQEEISTRLRGTDPFLPAVGLVCLRGRFVVADRAKVRRLTLSLSARGGFVAYLNGTEVARAHLPEGNLRPGTPADAYPPEAFFYRDSLEKGRPRPLDPNDLRNPQWALRERPFGPAEIPLDRLRDGVNVLAIELHRGLCPPQCARQPEAMIGTAGLGRLELRAEAEPGAIGGQPQGVQVWTVDTTRTLFDPALSAANERRGRVRIVGARNGTFAGQAIVAAAEPLKGLSAKASPLKQTGGSGAIPADAVNVRYGVPNPFWPAALREMGMPVTPPRWRRDAGAEGGTRFDMLPRCPARQCPRRGDLGVGQCAQGRHPRPLRRRAEHRGPGQGIRRHARRRRGRLDPARREGLRGVPQHLPVARHAGAILQGGAVVRCSLAAHREEPGADGRDGQHRPLHPAPRRIADGQRRIVRAVAQTGRWLVPL
ncbi:MAG: hypothetical protein FJ290_14045 [Planctomycetes bacterium]|nr:hypothetical protein [Planctomycetota bacterium]